MNATTIKLGGRAIGNGYPCFIIAEAGVNHNGSLDMALDLVEAASEAGADAVKFQLFQIAEQISGSAPVAEYQKDRTGSTNMSEMCKDFDLPWEKHKAIIDRCKELEISYMASCFDPSAVDFLLDLGGDSIKVGSGEITNFPLLRHMAKTGKPILLSTGMSTLSDVAQAVAHIRENGQSPLVLLQCVSNYPASPESINLRAMESMAKVFGTPVGYSDHTEGSAISIAAVALGACIIEKHFTLDRSLPGPDHAMSLEPHQLKELINDVRTAQIALGDGIKQPHESERATLIVARRSLVSSRPISAGTRLENNNVTFKRPATGIDPRLWKLVSGRIAAVDIENDIPITWEMLK